jgi:hypothetical protein
MLLRLAATVVTLLVATPAVAGCAERSTVAGLTATLDRIDQAYSTADTVGYAEAMGALGPQLDCSSEILPRSLIARIHRTQALGAFTAQDGMRLAQAFAAAKSIDPAYVYPESFIPPSHPLARMYMETEPTTDTVPIPPPLDGFLLLDGEALDARPAQRAVVVQHVLDRNQVAFTGYLLPGDRLPVATAEEQRTAAAHRARPFWIASVASASLGAVSYGVAASRRAAYEDAAPVDKPPLRAQTNGWVQVSAGFLGVAVGAGTAGLVVGL